MMISEIIRYLHLLVKMFSHSLVPRPSIIAYGVKGLLKLRCRMTSGDAWRRGTSGELQC